MPHAQAYAPLAVGAQRMVHLFASFAFLGAADLHAAQPRYLTGLILWLYTGVVITCLLQAPTDVALHFGRKSRESVLTQALEYSLGSNLSVVANLAAGGDVAVVAAEIVATQHAPTVGPFGQPEGRLLFRPEALAAMQYEPRESSGFFSPELSGRQFSFWQALMWARAALATFCWVTSTLLQSGWAFGVPPILLDQGQIAR